MEPAQEEAVNMLSPPADRESLCRLGGVRPDRPSGAVVLPPGFVIAVTSDFIPRLVYQYSYSHNGGTLCTALSATPSPFSTSASWGIAARELPVWIRFQFCRMKEGDREQEGGGGLGWQKVLPGLVSWLSQNPSP